VLAVALQEVLTPRLLAYVAKPLLVFEPLDPPALPEVWSPGRYHVRMLALGWLPVGSQWIGLELPDPAPGPGARGYDLRDNGASELIRRWDHRIRIEPTADGRTRYVDRVDLEAGVLTPLVWLFAQIFFRHRQRRWRRLVRRGFDYDE